MRVKKVRKDQASVDFLDPRGAPIRRSYMKGTPSVNMVARYDDYHETFEVDLWEEGKEFMLDLTHEYNYKLISSDAKHSCQPSPDMRGIGFWMSITRYSARWIALCEEGRCC